MILNTSEIDFFISQHILDFDKLVNDVNSSKVQQYIMRDIIFYVHHNMERIYKLLNK